MRAFASFVLFASAAGAAAQSLPDGVTLLRGTFEPNRQPDGNSILLYAPQGVIAIDTGRHAAHTERVIAAAQQRGQPIVAVINTHWHLDHIGGNARVRAAYPGVAVYASAALGDAQTGFLARYRAQLEAALAQSHDDTQNAAWRDEIALIDAGPALAPDHVVARTQTLTIAGRPLQLHLETYSVTAGDVWVFDPATRTLIAGDLVTLPVPLLDTACPARWQAALARLERTPFRTLLPGHGAPLDRAQLSAYATAFAHLTACAASAASKDTCIDGWLRDTPTLVPASEHAFARQLLDYYVDNALRAAPEKTAPLCGRTT